jgi:hypothetical protein
VPLASTILMIRPAAFGFNEQTAANNFFQTNAVIEQSALQQKALAEFDGMVQLLSAHGIEVLVIEDTAEPVKPDAVFPNNWFCTFPSGVLAVFPMYAPNRRAEKRDDVLQWLSRNFDVTNVQDWSEYEAEGHFLEGTGSMVIDHESRIIYACLSDRTSLSLLEKFASAHGYHAIAFHATDSSGRPVYHTNVVMCIGHGFAVLCREAIADEMELVAVTQVLESTNRTIISITREQMHAFAGNMLQLQNKDGDLFIVMSRSAWNVLDEAQRKQLGYYAKPLVIDVPTIEAVEGGSVRCMIAEIFLSHV